MTVAKSISEIKYDKYSIITVGTFDGIHLGHQKIISELKENARIRGQRSIIVTFEPHPREVVGKGVVKLLTSFEEKIKLLEKFDIDLIYFVGFTKEISQMTATQFYESYIVKNIGISQLILGHDHMLGHDRKAGIEDLRKIGNIYDFDLTVVDAVTCDGEKVSSSIIRDLLSKGKVEKAANFLSRHYSLSGKVVMGDQRGIKLGFPTANIEPDVNNKLVPSNGVYFVNVNIKTGIYFGMLNIGYRPTFNTGTNKYIEVNIFDLNQNIYGEKIEICFLKRIREEIKYSNGEELVSQMEKDRNICKNIMVEYQQ